MTTQSSGAAPREHGVVFHLESKSKNVSARGAFESADPSSKAFRVYAGSTGASDPTPTMAPGNVKRRNQLIQAGVLARRDDHLELSSDYTFSSTSAAASVLLAMSASGPFEWKTSQGQRLKDWLQSPRPDTGTERRPRDGMAPASGPAPGGQEVDDLTAYTNQDQPCPVPATPDGPEIFGIRSESKNVSATGSFESSHFLSKKFIVYRGSRAALHETPSIPDAYSRLRNVLAQEGALVRRHDHFEFSRDCTFTSPSTASSVVLGASTSGNAQWRVPDGKSLGTWLKDQTSIDHTQKADSAETSTEQTQADLGKDSFSSEVQTESDSAPMRTSHPYRDTPLVTHPELF